MRKRVVAWGDIVGETSNGNMKEYVQIGEEETQGQTRFFPTRSACMLSGMNWDLLWTRVHKTCP